jgi:uncharacterized RDD family membrane protein YckC
VTEPTSRHGPAAVLLPPGLRVASLGIRVAAFLIDGFLLGILHACFWVGVVVAGVVTIDPVAQRQLEAAPLTLPSVAPYRVNLGELAVMMVVFVALNVAYATFFWSRLRGMPGQRLLSLQVGSALTGRNLSVGQAFGRAVVALGIPIAAVGGLLFAVFALETSVPWADMMNPQPGGPAETWLSQYSAPLDLAVIAAFLWPVMLLLWTGMNPQRRGLHDRLAGSMVVGKSKALVQYGYFPGYGPVYGLPGAVPPGAVPPDGVPPAAWPGGEGAAGVAGHDPSSLPGEALYGSAQPPSPDPNSAWSGPGAGPETRDRLHVATINRRIFAYAFDCVFVYAVYAMTASIVVAALLPSTATTMDDRTFILVGLAGGLEQFIYFATGWVLRRGSVGQRLFHLHVTDATSGKPLGWIDALVRWAVLQGPFALTTIVPGAMRDVVILVASGWMLYLFYTTIVDPDQRGLQDKFLNSKVTQEV